ncbi:MAG: AMP-binding protein [Cyanobacteria bacterium P01_H01_bin.121]
MATPLEQLIQHSQQPWLEVLGSLGQPDDLVQQAQERYHYLQVLQAELGDRPLRVVITESDPITFLSSFVAACSWPTVVCLGNPGWGQQEWQIVQTWIQPDWVWGLDQPLIGTTAPSEQPELTAGQILIPTGGSSGQLRFAIHTWQTLAASVAGLHASRLLASTEPIHSVCVLPLYHVSGLMQFMRSLLTGGQLRVMPWRGLTASGPPFSQPTTDREFSDKPLTNWCLSLVPTQLQRLLETASTKPQLLKWLQQFAIIFLGGAPAWPALLQMARAAQLNLAPTYGMTETASQIVTLAPQDFLAIPGDRPRQLLEQSAAYCGHPLPHATLQIVDQHGKLCPAQVTGMIQIRARSLCQGYYPPLDPAIQAQRWPAPDVFCPDDLGYLDVTGGLHVVGRRSRTIISGGEKIFPGEVELVIRATGLVRDVAVLGLPDPSWGEVVVALYIPNLPIEDLQQTLNIQALQTKLRQQLSAYKCPKYWLACEALPRNVQGKLNYAQLRQIARDRVAQRVEANLRAE